MKARTGRIDRRRVGQSKNVSPVGRDRKGPCVKGTRGKEVLSLRNGVHRADAVVWEPVSHLHPHRQPLRGEPVARAEQRLFHAVLSAAKGRRDAEAVDLRGDGGSADTSAGDGEERLRARRRVVRAVRTEGRLIGG